MVKQTMQAKALVQPHEQQSDKQASEVDDFIVASALGLATQESSPGISLLGCGGTAAKK